MDTLRECFKVILEGDKDTSRQAARQARKLVYSPKSENQYNDISAIIENAPGVYEGITEDWRQENFVIAVSVMYFLHKRENQPNFLFPWLFPLLLHKNGNIRQSAVRMIDNEIGPLTVHLRFPNENFSQFHNYTTEQADHILFEMFVNLMALMRTLWKPAYKKYKFISSLPKGPYKSVQLVFSRLEEDCGKEYLARLEQRMESPW